MGKRSKKQEQVKKNNNALYVVAGIIVLAVLVIVFAATRPAGKVISGGSGELDEFATCLTEKGAIFYGTEWCGFCQQQKAMFGNSMNNINFIDCDQNRNTCMSEGITGYPTWKINGQAYSGVQQLTRLSDLTGCEIFPA
jgi:hypothetical protein